MGCNLMICPKCGNFIDAGEPCCPYCLYDPRKESYDPFDEYDDEEEGIETRCIHCGRLFHYNPETMSERDYCPKCLGKTKVKCVMCGKNFWCDFIERPICPECKIKHPNF